MKQHLRCSSLLLALCVLVCLLLPAVAEAEDDAPPMHTKVRVGYSASGSMLYQEADGSYHGYDALYLYEIARYTGWDYEFVPYTNWSQAVDDVAAGRIDLLPTVLKTPQREKEMLFSLYPMASTSIAVIARPDDTRYVYGDIGGTDGARVGVREQTADTKAFYQWAKKNGLSFSVADYNDRGDLLAALRAGDIDLAATSYAGEAQKFPAIAEFSPQAMYFAVTPQKPQLAARLDQAIGNILLYNTSFMSTLERIAQPDKNRYRVLVSEKEKAFLATLPPQRVALIADSAPYSYLRDGKMEGITVRVLERIAALTGLSFTYVPVKDEEEAFALMEKGELDLIGDMMDNHYQALAHDLRMTTPYTQESMALLLRKGHEPQRLAVITGDATLLKQQLPDAEYTSVDTLEEARALLEKGSVDGMACDMATATYYASLLHRSDYELRTLPNVPAYIALALPRDADPQLGFLIDRTIQYLVNAEMNEITQKEINEAPISFTNLFDRLSGAQANALVFLLVLAIGLLAYFLWMLWHKSRLERRVAIIEHEHDSITASLAWEKEIGHAQQEFFAYMDDNIMGPVRTSLKNLLAQGAASPDSPLYTEYLRCGQVQDFLLEVRLLNQLAQDEIALADWQDIPLADTLAQQGHILSMAAARKDIRFTMDFSGIGEEHVLVEKRLFLMILTRIMSYLIKYMPKGGSLLFSGSLSYMSEDPQRCVLWLFFHAPELSVSRELQQTASAMRETAQKNPRTIYECMSQAKCQDYDERDMLIRLAIIELLVPKLGGEWEISCTKAKGTEITLDFVLDLENGV